MLDQLSYRDKDAFLQRVHSVAALVYLAALLFLPLVFNHPLYLLGILVVEVLVILSSNIFEECVPFLVMGLWLAVLVMVLNPLLVQNGSTVLIYGPELPLFGRFKITIEAILFGASMGARLMAIILTFAIYNAVLHPDRVTGLFSRFAWKSSLVVSLATRMIPSTARDLANAREVQELRGVDFSSGGCWERLKKYTWLTEVILLSSLEGSLATAEAMQARGFGTGRRSCYNRELVRPRDYLCLCSGLSALGVGVFARIMGFADFTYYPRMDSFVMVGDLFWLGVILFCLSVPLVLGWGWKYWPYLRSKI